MTWTFLGGPLHGMKRECGGASFIYDVFGDAARPFHLRCYVYVPIRVQGQRVVAVLRRKP